MAFLASILYLSATLVAYILWKLFKGHIRDLTSPLRDLPGPERDGWLYGSFRRLGEDTGGVLQEQWVKQYGITFKVKGLFNRDRLYTVDTRAINHMFTHSFEYQKHAVGRYNLGRIVGEGVLIAEGEMHRKQRRVMNPGFGPAQVRELTGIFFEKASQLRDAWLSESKKTASDEFTKLDALAWLSRTTLDIIGLAGFNYRFNSLDQGDERNELNEALATMFRSTENGRFFQMLQARIPLLRYIKTERDRQIEYAQDTMKRIGYQLIAEKKAAVRAEKHGTHVEKGDVQGRDLLSLLIKANMAVDVPEDQKLSDQEMLGQIPTFMVAGHETTSTGTTWALFALTQNHDAQRKLREELLSVSSEAPSMDELQALPYLDAVVRESLRVHSPVYGTVRVPQHDDVLPLSKPVVDRKGIVHTGMPVNKGDFIFIPIVAVNLAKHIWGEDANEFKPERWLQPIPGATSDIPGVWGNQLTFLGGPRSCIGYRFALVEMKALLFVLIRAFEFKLAVPADKILKKTAIVTRPMVAGEIEKGNQLPILIKPYEAQP